MMKPRRVIRPGYVTHSGNMINLCTSFVGEICWGKNTWGDLGVDGMILKEWFTQSGCFGMVSNGTP